MPVASVPMIVARGMVTTGSLTLSVATLADSKPSSAHNVRIADPLTAVSDSPSAGKGVVTTGVSYQDDHGQQRNQFDEQGHDLETARRARAAPVDRGDDPDQRERRERHMLAERGCKKAEEADRGDRERHIGGPHRHPIGPADHEAGDAPEGEPDEGGRPARVRKGDGQPRENHRERQRAGDRDDPPRHAVPAERRKAGGEEEHPRPDHIAHHKRDTHRKAELLGGPDACGHRFCHAKPAPILYPRS